MENSSFLKYINASNTNPSNRSSRQEARIRSVEKKFNPSKPIEPKKTRAEKKAERLEQYQKELKEGSEAAWKELVDLYEEHGIPREEYDPDPEPLPSIRHSGYSEEARAILSNPKTSAKKKKNKR